MSINFHQLTQAASTILNLKRPPQGFTNITAGAEYLHPPAYVNGISHFELQMSAPRFHKHYGRGGMTDIPPLTQTL